MVVSHHIASRFMPVHRVVRRARKQVMAVSRRLSDITDISFEEGGLAIYTSTNGPMTKVASAPHLGTMILAQHDSQDHEPAKTDRM
jgi:hypothetical protein